MCFKRKWILDILVSCVQQIEHCKGSLMANSSKTNILKYQQHFHNPDCAKSETYRSLNEMKENFVMNFDIFFLKFEQKKLPN